MYQNEALCHQYTKVDVMVCEDVHINLWHYWSIAADVRCSHSIRLA